MSDGRTSKLVQIFGEHCVIAELSRRGLIAAAFSQQIPAYDIVATDERGKSVLIQVKASRSGSWQLAPITKWLEIKFDGDRQIPEKATPEPIHRLIVVFVQMGGHDYVVSTKLMVIRSRPSEVLPRFLYHFLTGTENTSWLQHLAESRSGTFPQITFDQVAGLELALPPLSVQAQIASFLDAIEAKIELNRRMNETLESIARVIFKSWFVNFTPVRAKAEGREAGLPKHIEELFPDSFVDSELGEIPKGWEVKAIGDLVEVVGGSTPSTKESAYWDNGTHHWATPKDLSALKTPVLLNTERCITDKGLAQISSGLLPMGTVLLSSRAPIGYLAVAEVPVAINQGFIAMRPKEGVSNLFLLLWTSSANDDILSRANGSTFLEISKANFRPILLIAPPAKLIKTFDQQVRPLYKRIVESERESQTLAALRDTLLPKLISGELRVKDADRFLKEVV